MFTNRIIGMMRADIPNILVHPYLAHNGTQPIHTCDCSVYFTVIYWLCSKNSILYGRRSFYGAPAFLCEKNLLEGTLLEKTKQSFTLVFSRGSNGLGNRRLERKIRANSISNFRLCADEKLDIVIYPVNPLEISAFACLSPAKSAQVHNPMADFQKKSPAGSGHKHFPKHKTGG